MQIKITKIFFIVQFGFALNCLDLHCIQMKPWLHKFRLVSSRVSQKEKRKNPVMLPCDLRSKSSKYISEEDLSTFEDLAKVPSQYANSSLPCSV